MRKFYDIFLAHLVSSWPQLPLRYCNSTVILIAVEGFGFRPGKIIASVSTASIGNCGCAFAADLENRDIKVSPIRLPQS